MKILFNHRSLEHNIHSEAEGAYRIESFRDLEDVSLNGEEYINLVHSEAYRESIYHSCQKGEAVAEVQLTPESYEAACYAVGLTVMAAEQGDFAVVRPPGHHASREKAAGFCFFNNIAIATQKLVNEGKRVFILDIDGHHGDGTQSIFYESNKVLFCSIHQEFAYPFTGFPEEQGEGDGKGFTINYPLIQGSGDKEFLNRVNKALAQARDFFPDVIAVSAGFDSYIDDKLLGLKYTSSAFFECGFRLRRMFKHTPIFAVLEGGYHQDVRKLVECFIEGVNKGAIPPKITWDENMAIG